MKKKLFFAAVVAAALAGCSSNENLENDLANVANPTAQDGRVPIVLGLSSNDVQVFKTRGTGTVGDIDDGTLDPVANVYNHEDLWVLMTTINKTPWGFTNHDPEVDDDGVTELTGANRILGEQFDGTFKARPYGFSDDGNDNLIPDYDSDAEQGYAAEQYNTLANMAYNSAWGLDYTSWNGGKVKYYPTDGTMSDFFAFHVDDAAVTKLTQTYGSISYDSPKIDKDEDEDLMFVNFKIDGSQDLLAGKAEYPNLSEGAARTGFNAKSARENKVPVIPMKHLLTRLTFDLVPGHQDAEGVIVTGIKVYSKSEGKLIVAYDQNGTKEPEDLIEWSEDEEEFSLKKKPAVPVDANGNKSQLVEVAAPFSASNPATYLAELIASPTDDETDVNWVANNNIMPNSDYDPTADPQTEDPYIFTPARMGDAMFVQPNQTEFRVVATMKFPITGYDKDYLTRNYEFYVRLKDAYGNVVEDGLEIGHSYNVQLKVYGLSKVELRTTLEAWEDGGDIEIDMDDPTNMVDWETLSASDDADETSTEPSTEPEP